MSDCLFCKLIAGKIPAKKIHEDDLSFGFLDINPQAPTHALFVPKRHVASVSDGTTEDRELFGHLVVVAAKYAREQGLDTGYRLVFNHGRDAGQTVAHVHLHLLGGRALGWPPG